MKIRTLAFALTALAFSTAGCAKDGQAATTTSPVATTSSASTSTTTSTSTTSTSTSTTTTTLLTVTTASTGVSGESGDWVTVVQGLLDVRHELFATPDPARVGEVYDPLSPQWPALTENLTNLQKDGQRTADQDPQEVRSVEVLSLVPPTDQGIEVANLRATIFSGPNYGRIVNSNGETVFELVPDKPRPADGLSAVTVNLVRTTGSAWRIFNLVAAT